MTFERIYQRVFSAVPNSLAFGVVLVGFATLAPGQERQLTVSPESLQLRVGQTGSVTATVTAADGSVDTGARVLFFSLDPADVSVSHTGVVSAHRAGRHTLVALSPTAGTTPGFTRPDDPGIRVEIPVEILPSELATLRFVGLPDQVFAGASLPIRLLAEDEGSEPRDVRAEITVQPEEVAAVAAFGPLFEGTYHAHPFYDRPRPSTYIGDAAGVFRALAPGRATLNARLGELSVEAEVEVIPNPARSLELTASHEGAPMPGAVRTGDVVRLTASVMDEAGGPVDSAPVRFSLESHPIPVASTRWERGRRPSFWPTAGSWPSSRGSTWSRQPPDRRAPNAPSR